MNPRGCRRWTTSTAQGMTEQVMLMLSTPLAIPATAKQAGSQVVCETDWGL